MTLAPPDDARAPGLRVRGCVAVVPSDAEWPEQLGHLVGRRAEAFGFTLELTAAAAAHLRLADEAPARLRAEDLGLSGTAARPDSPAPVAPASSIALDAADPAAEAVLRARAMVARVEAEIGDAARDQEQAAAEVRRLQQALATARARQDAVASRWNNLGSDADELRRAHDEALAAHHAAATAREELEEAIAALRRAQFEIDDRIAATRTRVGAMSRVQAAASEAGEHRDDVEARARDHRRLGPAPGTPDPTPVRLALGALDAVCGIRGGPDDPVARDLAEAWRALRKDLTIHDDPDAAETAARDTAHAARLLVDRLEEQHGNPGPGPDDHRAIEQAHRERLEATAAAQSRRAPDAARLRVQEAEHAEQALLARFGFASYAEYLIGSAGVGRAVSESPALMRARADLARAEAALIDAQTRRSVWLDSVGAKRDALRTRIAQHLGSDPGDDVLEALETPRLVPAPPVELLFGLEVALADVGVHDPGDDLLQAARRWLDQHTAGEEAHRHFERERAALAEERSEAIRRADEHERELAAVAALDAELEHLATVRANAEDQIEALVLKLASATEHERAAAALADRAADAARVIGSDATSIEEDTQAAAAAVAELSSALDAAYRDEARAEVVLEERLRFRAELVESLALADSADDGLTTSSGDRADAGDGTTVEAFDAPGAHHVAAVTTELEARIDAFFATVAPLRWAGARPVLAEDPLASLPEADVHDLLDAIEAAATATGTEVWYRSDDPAVIAWAEGRDRAGSDGLV